MGKSINEWVDEVHRLAVKNGWWDTDRDFPEVCATIHSEISEAFEEGRKAKMYTYYPNGDKPEGVPIELVDAMIRIMDYFGHRSWNLEKTLRDKHEFNKTRGYRHGGKVY